MSACITLAGEKAAAVSSTNSPWLAANPSKRWGEMFFLLYSPIWLTLILGIIVPYKLYEVLVLLTCIYDTKCHVSQRNAAV